MGKGGKQKFTVYRDYRQWALGEKWDDEGGMHRRGELWAEPASAYEGNPEEIGQAGGCLWGAGRLSLPQEPPGEKQSQRPRFNKITNN